MRYHVTCEDCVLNNDCLLQNDDDVESCGYVEDYVREKPDEKQKQSE